MEKHVIISCMFVTTRGTQTGLHRVRIRKRELSAKNDKNVTL